MCGRYFIDDGFDDAALAQIIAEISRRGDAKTAGEIRPGDTAPALATSRSLTAAAFPMEWGYALPGGKRLINARSETAAEKPLFQEAMRRHRCALPATNYFEWGLDGGVRRKYAIAPEAGGLFYLAGLYRLEAGRPVFTVLTRPCAPSIAHIHPRMPVMLAPEAARAWIDPSADGRALLSHALQAMRAAPVVSPDGEQMRMEL